ncbi:MAG TPA: hypothetical protein VFI85_05450 [Methyloceanibacter sp.]|jgi:hypothetical protein|nr:hypothetical protein [Methyloceanibacter sp.]
MRFFIGALAFLVIVALLASPAALMLGWVGIAELRQIAGAGAVDPALAPSQPAKQ